MAAQQTARAQWNTTLIAGIQLIGLSLSVPLAILVVGAPVALAVALLLWLGRMLLGTS